jgi:hypothetical protein
MNKTLIFMFLVLIMGGCTLFTEPDINNVEVNMISPVHDLHTTQLTQTFWWESVPDAEGYNLIIVSPLWDSVSKLILDTNIVAEKFTFSLVPGEYDWGVSAYNYSSSTPYTINHLVIDTSSSLNNQVVVLHTPDENLNTRQIRQFFSWYKLESAESYLFDIRYDSWQGSSVINIQNTSEDTITVTLPEGIFYWGVQARNDFSGTIFSTRSIVIDTTTPGKPIITTPQQHGDTLSAHNLKLAWTRPSSSLAIITDSVLVATDSLFTPSNITEILLVKETQVTLNNYSMGFYYCRVRSVDAAGNIGPVSIIKKFYVNEE